TIELPDYVSRKNKRNDYGYSVEEQATQTFTGMGMDINVHDQWACESMGPIQDRTREHLGSTDKGIITYRRMLMRAIDSVLQGQNDAPLLIDAQQAPGFTGPPSIDGVNEGGSDNDAYWREADRARRIKSDWASARLAA
ncbi:MAG: aromatic ring-hydroxylating dioxygenase subunit alpha, partial [Xenophilus sp.]